MVGRPRQFDREKALQVALHAFWRDGYDATSISGLTSSIGINPPSLYAAFGDKAHLFDEAADCYLERFRRGLREALEQPTTRQAISELLRVTAEAHTDPDTPPGCLVLSEPRLVHERAWMRDAIAERILQGQRDGDVATSASPQELATYLDIIMAGMSARARDGADRTTLMSAATLAARALDAFLGGGADPATR